MKFKKNGIVYTLPITFNKDGKKIITNDEKIILENGYEKYEEPKIEPSKQHILNSKIEEINLKTDRKILDDFTWNGHDFYLTLENQTNFANLFIARDFLTYPQTIKTKFGFATLNSKEEVQEFYLAGVAFVKQCLEEGWQEKIKVENEIRKNYK